MYVLLTFIILNSLINKVMLELPGEAVISNYRPFEQLRDSRDGFSCLEELGSLWYVGSRITLPDDQPEWARLLHQ